MIRAVTREAYWLLHEGILALSEMESTGMPVDVTYLNETIEKLDAEIATLRRELKEDKVFSIWHKHYGERAQLSSREQLGHVIFELLGFKSKGKTPTGRARTDESAFEDVDLPFVKKYLALERKLKDRNTFLVGIRDEVVDGRLHVNFNLNIPASYRSSADNPNSMNWPIRDPERGQLIRRCFIAPSEDYCLVEVDYKGIEVRGNCWYSHDPKLLNYILDPKTDMHRDMAMQIYFLKQDQVSKSARYAAKNMFVFPQFYGDWYVACARQLWEAIDRLKLTVGDKPLVEHLKANGIRERGACDPDQKAKPGTFEYHLKKVEEDFRGNRFKVHWEWIDRWYKEYRERGGCQYLTGFWIGGLMNKKEVVNYPVQGSAFHCLLWSLIHITKRIRKRRMLSRVINEIHDSIIAYVHRSEYDDYLEMVRQIMTVEIRDAWRWINTPLEIEVEVTPYGGNWAQKKAIEL